ncbi:MAG: hypothetical protein U9N36_02960 [Euryarchaeota archaeon]|nr:hypothetical protein [Euryarchaeota archaeon]
MRGLGCGISSGIALEAEEVEGGARREDMAEIADFDAVGSGTSTNVAVMMRFHCC